MRPRGAPLLWDPGTANPKQREFFRSRALYTAYGGAKGGGKTWAVRTKALLGAYYYPGIRILIMRRTYPELLNNHIEPMRQALRPAFAKYSAERRAIYFANGSVIRFGHWAGERSEGEYNGQEYDWIFHRRGHAVHLEGLPVPGLAAARRERHTEAHVPHLQPGRRGAPLGEEAFHRPRFHHRAG